MNILQSTKCKGTYCALFVIPCPHWCGVHESARQNQGCVSRVKVVASV